MNSIDRRNSPLGDIARIRDVQSRRISSWDQTGGNNDFLVIQPGGKSTIADIRGSGCINHIWCTHMSPERDYLRMVVLRMWWDGEDEPSVEAPLGDFFGVGHAKSVDFVSLPLQMSPNYGKSFNCWFPMPFSSQARMEIHNESGQPLNFYYYVDYELNQGVEGEMGRFHAQWRRENPCQGVDDSAMSNVEFSFGGSNIGGKGNYVILDAEGRGHYVGCNLNIHNLRLGAKVEWPEKAPWPFTIDGLADEAQVSKLMQCFNWYGEGDDMIFIDGDTWPPSLHGTGTEDYFNTAYCPMYKYDAPYHGVTLPGGPNWSGKISLYRFHIEDAIHFSKSIRVTIEHGHNNHRSDDYSSTAYWYQLEPHKSFPALPGVKDRLPNPD